MENNEILKGIYCVPATIRKCNGAVIKLDEDKLDTFLLVLRYLQAKNYNTYSLKINTNEKGNSEPKEILNGSFIDTTIFGWFITKDKMEFPSESIHSSVQLSTSNRVYYKLEKRHGFGDVVSRCMKFKDGLNIELEEILYQSTIMNEISFITSALEHLKDIKNKYKK